MHGQGLARNSEGCHLDTLPNLPEDHIRLLECNS